MQKAEKERGSGVHGVKVKAWNDKLIDSLDDRLQECTKHIDSVANDCIKAINEFHDSANSKNSDGTDKSSKAVNYIMGKFNQRMEEILNETSHKTLGIGTGKETSNIDTTKIHEYCQLMFTGGDNERTEEITVSYVEHNLVGTKKAASKVKESQKAFNKAYDDAIKKIKKITADMENKDAKGYSQYIHKATATMSKIQTLVNAYATSGYRALIGRANESKALCGVIISGKAGKRKAD